MSKTSRTNVDQRVIVVAGDQWTVYEHRPGGAEHDPAHLLFVSNAEVRRLTVFPENWLTLDDEGLAWLAGVAVTVRHRRNSGHARPAS
ncbi:MAG TPA: hypothetical protein VMH39_07280 [Gemmatimonadaceae bacterium]|nr:hypothetical protein [Gemmatimonadaceae bacterium]